VVVTFATGNTNLVPTVAGDQRGAAGCQQVQAVCLVGDDAHAAHHQQHKPDDRQHDGNRQAGDRQAWLARPPRPPQDGRRVVEPDHGNGQDHDPGQDRRPVGGQHAQRQQQDVDEVDQGLAAKPEDRDRRRLGPLKVKRKGDEDEAKQYRCGAGDRQVELAPLVDLLFEAHGRS
jgi:hypothetical protein